MYLADSGMQAAAKPAEPRPGDRERRVGIPYAAQSA